MTERIFLMRRLDAIMKSSKKPLLWTEIKERTQINSKADVLLMKDIIDQQIKEKIIKPLIVRVGNQDRVKFALRDEDDEIMLPIDVGNKYIEEVVQKRVLEESQKYKSLKDLKEGMDSFERVEGKITDILLLGEQGGIRRIILDD